jgi:hypothetical protein
MDLYNLVHPKNHPIIISHSALPYLHKLITLVRIGPNCGNPIYPIFAQKEEAFLFAKIQNCFLGKFFVSDHEQSQSKLNKILK